MADELRNIRERIDGIDTEMRRLLNERAQCAMDVAAYKAANVAPDQKPVYYRPEREAAILTRLKEANEGPLSDDDIARLFREIISCCLSLEQPLTIAYFGPAGTYTEAATIKQFGHFARTNPHGSIDEVFREVESGAAHYGVVPVENSTEGAVNHTLDCFMTSPLKVCAEVELPIHHAFMLNMRGKPEDVVEIVSHQQSLAQCRAWLDTHYPDVVRTPVASNAEAARMVAEQTGKAAIAGEVAAERYGLRVVASNIEDQGDNTTRFLVIGDQDVDPSGRDKSSIVVSTKNEPGALVKILEPFDRHGISLTRIETRPSKVSNWTYVFFIDFEGHWNDEKVQDVIREVMGVASDVRNLGSYPMAVI